jgi:hypothetical protein
MAGFAAALSVAFAPLKAIPFSTREEAMTNLPLKSVSGSQRCDGFHPVPRLLLLQLFRFQRNCKSVTGGD